MTYYKSFDLLGFWFEIKAYEKNNHRQIFDISESRSSLTGGLFFSHNEDIGPDSVDFERQPSTGSFIRLYVCSSDSSHIR